MKKTISATGSCLCGAISIHAMNIKPSVDACHCSMCRKWSGSPLLAVECGTEITFEPNSKITTYQSSEWAERGFCKECGTHLFYRLKQNQQHIVPVGLFEIDEVLTFTTQIFIEEKPEYYSFANDTENMTGKEVFAAFSGV